MLQFSALPWNVIGVIIGLALLIPTIVALINIRRKRYEDVGWIIGFFLVSLGLITFFVIIPYFVIDEARLPEDYLWEDEGEIYYWEKNSLIAPHESNIPVPPRIADFFSSRKPIEKTFIGKEIIQVVTVDENSKEVIIQDALLDENDEVFTVINGNEPVVEWYTVDSRLSSLKFVKLNSGSMAIPSHSKDSSSVTMGWVESGGSPDGDERLVLLRSMKKTGEGKIQGNLYEIWESAIYNQPILWHGESYYCDETLRLIVDPETAYVINVKRELVLSAHLSHFIELYYPSALKSQLVTKYLAWNDPIGEAAILRYETTEESQSRHILKLNDINNQLNYFPPLICIPMICAGLILVWRYCGRSYYWRKYKQFER